MKVDDLVIYEGKIAIIIDTENCYIDVIEVVFTDGSRKKVSKTGLVAQPYNNKK